ncbi:hypothetical protein KA107_01010 [Candidatus Pacearchaeota archaeon]|nr:hypothetical protein [Candidatus Pacearchaeota archaeon]
MSKQSTAAQYCQSIETSLSDPSRASFDMILNRQEIRKEVDLEFIIDHFIGKKDKYNLEVREFPKFAYVYVEKR